MDLQNLFHRAVHVVFTGRLGVEGLHGERAPRDSETWCIPVKVGELGIEVRMIL